jgi:hypothetical protein
MEISKRNDVVNPGSVNICEFVVASQKQPPHFLLNARSHADMTCDIPFLPSTIEESKHDGFSRTQSAVSVRGSGLQRFLEIVCRRKSYRRANQQVNASALSPSRPSILAQNRLPLPPPAERAYAQANW